MSMLTDALAEARQRRERLAAIIRCPKCGRYSETTATGRRIIQHRDGCTAHANKGDAA